MDSPGPRALSQEDSRPEARDEAQVCCPGSQPGGLAPAEGAFTACPLKGPHEPGTAETPTFEAQ